MIRVAVTGSAGRMGRNIIAACQQSDTVQCTVALENPQKTGILGTDAGELAGIGKLNVAISGNLIDVSDQFDAVIDFTHPTASIDYLTLCQGINKPMVIGTTGFSVSQKARIEQAAERISIVLAPNMSVGVNLCFKLLSLATQVLGHQVDVEIIEAHHRHKADAPSGTALRMGEVIAQARGQNLHDCAFMIGGDNR